MMWLPFAVAAPLAWAMSNLVDARLVNHNAIRPTSIAAIAGMQGAVPLSVGLVLHGAPSWSNVAPALIALAAGIVGVLVYIPYLHALSRADPAETNAMWTMSPAIAAVLAVFTLSESLPIKGYIGVACLMLAALIAGSRQPNASQGGTAGGAFSLMALASLLFALEGVLQKAVFQQSASYADGVVFLSGSSLIAGTALWVLTRRKLTRALPNRQAIGLIAANQVLDIVGGACVMTAIALGPVTAVRAVGALQPLMVLAIAPLMFRTLATQATATAMPRGRLFVSVVVGLAGIMLVNGFGE